jgi:hypothetical protein
MLVVWIIRWEKKEGEAHTDSLKRALVLKAMSAADDEDTAKIAAEKFSALKADQNVSIDPVTQNTRIALCTILHATLMVFPPSRFQAHFLTIRMYTRSGPQAIGLLHGCSQWR